MTLSVFKDTTNWHFRILSWTDYETWKPPTRCCRLVTIDGAQVEMRAQGTAKAWLESLSTQLAYATMVSKSCVKAYAPKAAALTGINATHFLTLKFPFKNVVPQDSLFPFLTTRTEFIGAAQIAGKGSDEAFNIKVEIVTVRDIQHDSGLAKRVCTCTSGDFEMKLEILGDMAKIPPAPGSAALLGVRLNDYRGVWTLITTRLSAICLIDPAEIPPRTNPEAPMRTEIKPSSLRVSSVTELMQGLDDKDRVRVEAKIRAFDGRVFDTAFVWDDHKFRLYATFYKDAAHFSATVWTDDVVTLVGQSRDELNDMWESCDPGSENFEAARTQFLQALNGNADAEFSMMVACKTWIQNSPSKQARTEESANRASVQYSVEDLRLV